MLVRCVGDVDGSRECRFVVRYWVLVSMGDRFDAAWHVRVCLLLVC